jgi:hypothetical protein
MQHLLPSGFTGYVPTGSEPTALGLPFRDFVEDAGIKKGFAAHSYTTLPGGKPGAFQFVEASVPDWDAMVENVQAQYTTRVGALYNVKQTTLWLMLATQASAVATAEAKEASAEAHVVAGRLLYEGLGLAGFSPAAKAFCQVLPALAFDGLVLIDHNTNTEDRFEVEALNKLKPEDLEPGDKVYEALEGLQHLVTVCTGYPISLMGAAYLQAARRVQVCARDMLANNREQGPRFADEELLGSTLGRFAPIAQMMRIASKGIVGDDATLEAVLKAAADENGEAEGPTPLAEVVAADEDAIRHFFGNNRVATGMVFRALNIQLGVLNAKRQAAETKPE